MRRRELPGTDITLSQVCFGSMRFLPERITEKEGIRLLTELVENGITTIHSSHEYESHSYFCKLLSEFTKENPSRHLEHLIKLPAPHFKDKSFSKIKFIQLVEEQLTALGTEQIAVVQWLLRHEPNVDQFRLPLLEKCTEELREAWVSLKESGKVGALYSFPYSNNFAASVLDLPLCGGLMDYLNLIELDKVPLLPNLVENNQGFIAIRPFFAGKINEIDQCQKNILLQVFNESDLNNIAIQFPLLHPAVITEVVSFSSLDHLENIIENTSKLNPNQALFNDVLSILN
jgi:aryl-alcohol dehydrogenase-like predicted oxidoreductase